MDTGAWGHSPWGPVDTVHGVAKESSMTDYITRRRNSSKDIYQLNRFVTPNIGK